MLLNQNALGEQGPLVLAVGTERGWDLFKKILTGRDFCSLLITFTYSLDQMKMSGLI